MISRLVSLAILFLAAVVFLVATLSSDSARPNRATAANLQVAGSLSELSPGTFPLPTDSNYPRLIGYTTHWIAEQNRLVMLPCFTKIAGDYFTLAPGDSAWTRHAGTLPSERSPGGFASPQSSCWLPGLKRILVLKEESNTAKNKAPASGWLFDPANGRWTAIDGTLKMGQNSTDFNPSAGRDEKRLPVWGTLVYDPHNREALAFGGGGIWGRVGEKPEKVSEGDWIFDPQAKRIRRLTADDAGKLTMARRWFPAHAGSWTFSEASQRWQSTPQPLGEQPSTRILPGMAYDPTEKKIVLFGGDDLARCFDDTWIYDCTQRTWSQATPKAAPRARAGQAMVYVPELGGVLLAGGYTGGWLGLSDVWLYRIKDNTWTCLGNGPTSPATLRATRTSAQANAAPQGLHLPAEANYCSAAYDEASRRVLLTCYTHSTQNKAAPLYALNLANARANPVAPAPVDPRLAYHCKAQGPLSTLLPDEWEQGANAPGSPQQGEKELAALPANRWVERKFPVGSRLRDWGHVAYDPRTHIGYTWGGGHSTYPGAEISEYNVLTNRWRSMAHATNYNPVWLHGMVGGPPGVSPAGWSLLPTHARKSYTIDPISNMVITYVGDVYDPRHHTFVTNIGECPGRYDVATQVSFVATPHGLYGYSTGTLAKPNVAAGKWDVVAQGGPTHQEHNHLAYDSQRDQLVYFQRKQGGANVGAVWTFDFKSKQWQQQQVSGPRPSDLRGDSTYIPELDAVLLIYGEKEDPAETMYFYKVGERRWYSAPYVGDPALAKNPQGLNYSPHYDPQLKTLIRFTRDGNAWTGVFVMRLDPATLQLRPL